MSKKNKNAPAVDYETREGAIALARYRHGDAVADALERLPVNDGYDFAMDSTIETHLVGVYGEYWLVAMTERGGIRLYARRRGLEAFAEFGMEYVDTFSEWDANVRVDAAFTPVPLREAISA